MKKIAYLSLFLAMVLFAGSLCFGQATLPLKAIWTAPTTNTDGTPITDALTYNLYRTDGTRTKINSSPITSPGTSSSPYLFSTSVTGSGTATFVVTAVDTVSGNESADSTSAGYAYTTFQVTATAGANGTLDSSTPSPATVLSGGTTSFKFNANSGYHVASVSGCGGTSYSNTSNTVTTYTYTTGAITAACTVSATFVANANVETPTAPSSFMIMHQ